jgi:hypothetical protein
MIFRRDTYLWSSRAKDCARFGLSRFSRLRFHHSELPISCSVTGNECLIQPCSPLHSVGFRADSVGADKESSGVAEMGLSPTSIKKFNLAVLEPVWSCYVRAGYRISHDNESHASWPSVPQPLDSAGLENLSSSAD